MRKVLELQIYTNASFDWADEWFQAEFFFSLFSIVVQAVIYFYLFRSVFTTSSAVRPDDLIVISCYLI